MDEWGYEKQLYNFKKEKMDSVKTSPSTTGARTTDRQINRSFRTKRFPQESIFLSLPFNVSVGNEPADINNISLTGAGLRARAERQEGEQLPIKISAKDGTNIFSGSGTVAWAKFDKIATDFGFKFDAPVNLDAIRQTVRRIDTRIAIDTEDSKLFELLPTEYKILSSELMHHLASLRIKAEKLEPEGVSVTPSVRQANARQLLEQCGPDFQRIWYNFNDISLPVQRDDPSFKAMKWYTENVLRPMFMGAPVWKRSWDKPLGYPGDYKIMLYAYDSDEYVDAPSLYDTVVHGYLAHTLGACIRGRMHLTIKHLQDRLSEISGSAESPCEVLNLGCGAAREIPIILADRDAFQNKHVNFNLLDQDEEALQHAMELALPAAEACGPSVSIKGLNVPLLDIVRSDTSGSFDIVYSLGLIDYLPFKMAKRIAREMYDQLKPGGIITWCNVSTNRETCYWPLEFITDWTLYYRGEEEMRDMFDFPGAEITLQLEESNQIWVINAKKPK